MLRDKNMKQVNILNCLRRCYIEMKIVLFLILFSGLSLMIIGAKNVCFKTEASNSLKGRITLSFTMVGTALFLAFLIFFKGYFI